MTLPPAEPPAPPKRLGLGRVVAGHLHVGRYLHSSLGDGIAAAKRHPAAENDA